MIYSDALIYLDPLLSSAKYPNFFIASISPVQDRAQSHADPIENC